MELYKQKLEPIYTTKADAANNIEKFIYQRIDLSLENMVTNGVNSLFRNKWRIRNTKSFEKAGAITNTLIKNPINET